MTGTSFLVERAVGRFSCLAEVEVTAERTGNNIAGISRLRVNTGRAFSAATASPLDPRPGLSG